MTIDTKITVEKLTDERIFRRACDLTLHKGEGSKAPLGKMYKAEHSPIRTQMFWVEMLPIYTFVSVHFVRHKTGVEHFVQTMRDDRGATQVADRYTPVRHGMLLNAQALITMARKRLCLHAHKDTVKTMSLLRKAVREVDPLLADAMVPECLYRGHCPEMRQCATGEERVMASYRKNNKLYGGKA